MESVNNNQTNSTEVDIKFRSFPSSDDDEVITINSAPSVKAFTPPFQPPTNGINNPSSSNFEKPNLLSLLFGFGKDKRTKRSAESEKSESWERKFMNHFNDNAISYRICVFGVVLMIVYEILQCIMSYKTYFFKLNNWLDISMIYLSYVVLLGSFNFEPQDFKKIRALMILLMAAQTIQLVAKVSFLSMSLHMAIFKKVCKTFLKTIALYLIMILAFAMSFYTLNDTSGESNPDKKVEDGEETFSNPFLSVITTVRMMLSDFENIKIDKKDHFQGFMFLLFVILITVVLFNLLNALAISDTHDIIREAELVEAIKRISIISSYEKLFTYLNLKFANIFPEMAKIIITPNKDKTVKTIRSFEKIDKSVAISIHKTSKSHKLIHLTAKNKQFWKNGSRLMKLDTKVFDMILNFVKNHNEKTSQDFK